MAKTPSQPNTLLAMNIFPGQEQDLPKVTVEINPRPCYQTKTISSFCLQDGVEMADVPRTKRPEPCPELIRPETLNP